ncbi:sulfotransferase [gamma proteobacterium NOR5-3]|nr:sulfotransferase [gamma proteobacterium NOR5-3]
MCIGAQRAGTTWLYECLREHPGVFLPDTKELHFFNKHFDQGLAAYMQHFSSADCSKKICGEVTPNYYHDELALSRMAQVLPDAKIIFIVREPVSRAYSHYQLSIDNQCKGMTFKEALSARPIIKELSFQGKYLEKVYELYSVRHVHVGLYDDLQESPARFYEEVLRFLGVDYDFTPSSLGKRVNRIVFPGVQKALRGAGLAPLVDLVKETPIGNAIKARYNARGRFENSNALYGELFAEDVNKLEKLIKRDLSSWKLTNQRS